MHACKKTKQHTHVKRQNSTQTCKKTTKSYWYSLTRVIPSVILIKEGWVALVHGQVPIHVHATPTMVAIISPVIVPRHASSAERVVVVALCRDGSAEGVVRSGVVA